MIGLMFCAVFLLAAYWLWQKNQPDSGNEPPPYRGALPIIGHAHLLFGDSRDFWKTLEDFTEECIKAGGVITARIGPRTAYAICDPDDAMTVANNCLEKDDFYGFGEAWLGQGLVTGKLSLWRNHRKLLNPAFSQLVLDGFLGVFNKQARSLVKDLAKEAGKGPFDHWTYTRNNALETICLTALNVDFTDQTLLNKDYMLAAEEIFNVLMKRVKNLLMHNNWIYSWTGLKKKQDRLLKTLHSMSDIVLQRRKSEMNGNIVTENLTKKHFGSKFKPFLDLLLELTLEKNAFTDQEIREHIDTIIVAGQDTSATVLMYAMILIGSYPDVQERLFREIEEVFGNLERDVEKHDLCKLVYLEAVIKESLRILPIVPVIARKLDRIVKLKNHTLSAGRTCFILLGGLNRHPVWGADAQEFKPERWLDPATLPDNPNAFAGFSMGRRHCIGKLYALMSMKVTLAHVLRHYRIKADITQLTLKLDILLKPASGHHITIEHRNLQ